LNECCASRRVRAAYDPKRNWLLSVSDALAIRENKKLSNVYLRTAITGGAFIVAFLLGYSISARTGIEPGYFAAVEVGSYGAPAGAAEIEGLSAQDADYYKSLAE